MDLGDLGLDRGAHLLIGHALADLPPGGRLAVLGRDPALTVHLRGWCRTVGHGLEISEDAVVVIAGDAKIARWQGAERAGDADMRAPGAIAEIAPANWGLAARGALVEAGGPAFQFALDHKDLVWTDDAARLYAQAAAAQWDPATAIPWDTAFDLPPEIEAAVVQVMTYLIENEHAALLVPARFLGQVHPHFREIMQLLAIQVADEARHVEVFTRRATLKGERLGLSTAGGQASLQTLLEEPDFAMASFLLAVMGEGTFLALLAFIDQHAPDPVTRAVARLAAQDEARHVAFGMAHLEAHIARDPSLRERLTMAVNRRHDALSHTAGLNAEVADALVLLAAGEWSPEAVARGFARVQQLRQDMDNGRRGRLQRLGFPLDEAAALSGLHTRNFM